MKFLLLTISISWICIGVFLLLNKAWSQSLIDLIAVLGISRLSCGSGLGPSYPQNPGILKKIIKWWKGHQHPMVANPWEPLLKLPNVWSFRFWLVWNGLSHQFHWFWLRLLTNMFISFFPNSASSCSLWKSMCLLHCLAAFLWSTLGCLEQLQFNSVKKKVGNCCNFRWSFNGQSIGKPCLTSFYFYHQILTCRQYHMIV